MTKLDTMPDGTFIYGRTDSADDDRQWFRVKWEGRWWYLVPAASNSGTWTVVHVPDAPSVYPFGDPDGPDCPKMVRETLCVAQGVVSRSPEVDARCKEHAARIGRLIDICDQHRPLGPNGKHRTAHCTPTCGCEDKRQPIQEVAPSAPSVRDALHTIGLTDHDIAYMSGFEEFGTAANRRVTRKLRDAAREAEPQP